MARAAFLIAPAALHVDADREPEARAILDRFMATASIEAKRVRWMPYPKLGPHSRLSFFALIANHRDEAECVGEVERICACLVGAAGLGNGREIDFTTEGGGRHYERTFSRFAGDAGITFFPGTNWFDIELDFYPPIQARLRRILRRGD